MKILDKSIPFFISHNENHKVDKLTILDNIRKIGKYSIVRPHEEVDNTDYHVREDYLSKAELQAKKDYFNVIMEFVRQHYSAIADKMNLHGVELATHYWFHQYTQVNSHFDFHMHQGCMLSNIYYVELPEGAGTIFKTINGEFKVDVKEGDLLTFPSIFLHKSAQLKTKSRKTIISFNSDVF